MISFLALAFAVVLVTGLVAAPTPKAAAAESCGEQARPIAEQDGVSLRDGLPVLFIHGIRSDRGHWTDNKLESFHRRLREKPGVKLWTFDYSSANTQWVTHDSVGPAFARAIDCLSGLAGRSIVVVAHSMGGLVTQFAQAQTASDGRGIARRIASVVTVGTPFKGSDLLSVAQGVHVPVSKPLLGELNAVLSACRLVGRKCDVQLLLDKPVGRALRTNSEQLRALPAWPEDLPVRPIAGDIVYRFKMNLFVYHHEADIVSIGDPYVSVKSATAHRVMAEENVRKCDDVGVFRVWEVFSSSCGHSNLKRREDVQDEILDAVSEVAGQPAGTVYFSRYDPATYRAGFYAKTGARPARRIAEGTGRLSPDGRYRAEVDTSGDGPARLIVEDLDRGVRQRLADGANGHGLCNEPEWTPDGKYILFQQTPNTGRGPGQWARVEVATGAATLLAAHSGCYPVYAPDGQSIAWYDGLNPRPGRSTVLITDADGGNGRHVPAIGGVDDPCANAVAALSSGGRLALVEASHPGERACGDGPGRQVHDGLVVDTSTGRPIPLPVPGPVRGGVFLSDGGLLVQPAGAAEFVLLDRNFQIKATFRGGILAEGETIHGYSSF
ncbi:alpha/beta fold hydrolase [Amycolatopsis japonica]